jgi:hypothetical protein
MGPSRLLPLAVALLLLAGCVSFKAGREFASPEPSTIVAGKTGKSELRRTFGEPYEVGLDSGDPTWTWFFARSGSGEDRSKSLTVRFNADGTVKSYSFSSNFPDDMQRLK